MNILLIEDDLDDIELLQEAFHMQGIDYQMEVINDGNTAVEYFRQNNVEPDIIVLDLNLPKVHGKEVLLEIKASSAFQHTPLVIITTSSSKEDIDYASKKGVDKYLIKPANLPQIKETVAAIILVAEKNK